MLGMNEAGGTMISRIAAVRIFTTQLDRARVFYGDVLGLAGRRDGPGYAVFSLGETDVIVEAVAADDAEAPALVGRFLALSFAVDDMGGTYEDLRAAGVAFLAPPRREAWGGTLAHARDPDGNVFTLVG
jgi:predicted enzyme related to lactoylglutathione lyase